MAADKQPQRTASQRIDDLERGLMALYQTADNMARDLMTIKEAIKLLGNKLDSVVKASGISDDTISKLMIENNVSELKDKVDELVRNGVLVATDEVKANSFVVGRELGEDGAVQNPRMQFVVSALQPNVGGKFPGAKVGQVLDLEEGKWKFEVLEAYDIASPEQQQASAEQQESASEAQAPEAQPESAPESDGSTAAQ